MLFDLDGNLIRGGDIVENLRYEMGECKLVITETGFEYHALDTDKKVSWLRMIDAATERQKVRKITDD